jgi:nucleoside-diphosphate-sugar epimerase
MILLTGGTGMLGAHIAFDLAKSGKKIRALKREGSSIATTEKIFRLYSNDAGGLLSRIEWVNGDLLDLGSLEDAMQGINQVYHSAAIVSYRPADKERMLEANIEGTANLINTALDAGVKKFCHISSVAALGRTINGHDIDEAVWWKTSPENSWYAISKYGAEREAWRASEEGMDVIILNPSFILGPGNGTTSSSEIFGLLRKGIAWYTNGVTGYVDARDVSAAAVQLMDSTVKNERFVLSAANMSYREFFDKALKAFGRKSTRYHASPLLTAIGWRGEKILAHITGRKPALTKETAMASRLVNHFNGSKITQHIPFRYRDIDATIGEVCSFYMEG